MSAPDLNQLTTLEILLSEGSVVGAARRLRLSPSAMSRALARLRETFGDPLLVRAGRGLVPTPRALALREPVARVVEEATRLLRAEEALDLGLHQIGADSLHLADAERRKHLVESWRGAKH